MVTASVRLIPALALEPSRLREPLHFASPAVGVGHRPVAAMVSSEGRPRLIVLFPSPLPEEPYDLADGVGSWH